MSTEIKLRVTEIQRFCMHDGPGVRTTVFLKGCPLRCAWCHNPETQRFNAELLFYPTKCIGCSACEAVCPNGVHAVGEQHAIDRTKCTAYGECVKVCPTNALELCGTLYTIGEILSVVKKDLAFYGKNGGVTLSGGEPLAQGEASVELLQACKENGFSTAVETCGHVAPDLLQKAAPYVDLFLWDIKDTDSARHKQYTGFGNERILENLSLINEMNAKIRLRCILVNGVNTDERHYSAIAELASKINNLDGVEWLPYHAYGGTKSVFLGGEDSGRKEWIPTPEQMEKAKEIVKSADVNLF